jgi:F-type H+-transporting ATPase subunit gamma
METIAMDVIPMILDMMFYDIILEAKASEHSARMVAMKAAKDNSKKIADMLTLKYNKARQGLITREVSEIVAGVEALKDI